MSTARDSNVAPAGDPPIHAADEVHVMTALVILALLALWVAVGVLVWRLLLGKRLRSGVARIGGLIAFLAVWTIGPWVDDIWGVRKFDALCRSLPPITFHGPVKVGAGAFYDSDGRPRFAPDDDLSASTGPWSAEFRQLFGWRDETVEVSSTPIPIFETRTTHYDKRNNDPVVEQRLLGSKGGWIRRVTGLASLMPLTCPARGSFPKASNWVEFKPGGQGSSRKG